MLKIKSRKKLDVKALLAVFAAATVLLTGCADKKKNEESQNVDSTVATSSETEETQATTEEQYEEIVNTDIDTLEKSFYGVTENYFLISMSKEDIRSALILLNMEYLKENDRTVLENYFEDKKGINTSVEMNKLYKFLSLVREYNTNLMSKENYLSLSSLLLSTDDKECNVPFIEINAVEDNCRLFLDYNEKLYSGKNTEEDDINIQDRFAEVLEFANGTGKINGFTQAQFSRDSIIASEVVMQQISVLAKDYISKGDIEKLNKALDGHNYVYSLEQDIARFSGVSSLDEPAVQALVAEISKYRAVADTEIINTGIVSFDEFRALFTIANIEYYMKDDNGKEALATLYDDGFILDSLFVDAENAVSKIELYNASLDDKTKIYDYSHLFVSSVSDIMNTKYVARLSYDIYKTNGETLKVSADKLKLFNQYNEEIKDNYTYDNQTYRISKNALNKGATQIVNWISYYAYINNPSKFETNYRNDMLNYVNGTIVGLNPYDDIVLMTTGFCANKNSDSFTYDLAK